MVPTVITTSEDGSERTYQLANDREVTIKIDDDAVISYWENGQKLGSYNDFVFIEDEFIPHRYLLARIFVPITRSGLGRATIEFFKDYFDATIWVRPNDGIEMEDGSHLTGDGVPFVSQMIAEKLIENNEEEIDNNWIYQ